MKYSVEVFCTKKNDASDNTKDDIQDVEKKYTVEAESPDDAGEKALNLFHEDVLLNFPENYWIECNNVESEDYPIKDWQYEVANGDTLRGYWEWVEAKTEEK